MEELDVNNIRFELGLIVKSITKAVGPDIMNYLINNNMDTYNAISYLRGDFINTNLRDTIVSINDNVELKHFKRFIWTGSLLIDHQHKTTITISTKSTLNRIRAERNRKNPHYLQSICHVLNGDLLADCKQMKLSDLEGFDVQPLFGDEVYENDFDTIMDAAISPEEGYRHYVVAYEAERLEVKSLSLMILDKDLDVVRDISLMDLLQPDFGNLTVPSIKTEGMPEKQDVHRLIKIKPGIKSKNANEPERRLEITPKGKEVGKQA